MSDLFDTCVFIDYWKGDPAAIALIDAAKKNPASAYYSTLSATELWQYSGLDRREEIEYVALIRFFLKEAPLHVTEAIKAGEWLRPLSRNMRMILTADALIAATAEVNGCRIITRNVRDLKKFYSNVSSY